MKTITLIFAIVALSLSTVNLGAQNLGIRAGADFATARAKALGVSISNNDTGFYVGLFTNFNASESFKIRPEANYINIDDTDLIQIPVLASLALAEKVAILAGPSFGFFLDKEEGTKSFNFGMEFGLSYDILENLLIEGRYSLGVTNLADGNYYDVTALKFSGIMVGLGYQF